MKNGFVQYGVIFEALYGFKASSRHKVFG